MKAIITIMAILFSAQVFAQSKNESDILALSKQIFNWEVADKIDSLANLFDEKFIVVGSSGEMQTKEQYIARLKSGSFIHNNIEVEESIATVVNNTATVVGKGMFTVTVSGNNISLHLSYIEVFTKNENGWRIMAMHASKL